MVVTKEILANLIILDPKHKENTVAKLSRLTKAKLLEECVLLNIAIPIAPPKKDKAPTKPRVKKEVDNSTEEKRRLSSRLGRKEDKGDFISWKRAQRWTKTDNGEYSNSNGELVENIDALFMIFASIK